MPESLVPLSAVHRHVDNETTRLFSMTEPVPVVEFNGEEHEDIVHCASSREMSTSLSDFEMEEDMLDVATKAESFKPKHATTRDIQS